MSDEPKPKFHVQTGQMYLHSFEDTTQIVVGLSDGTVEVIWSAYDSNNIGERFTPRKASNYVQIITGNIQLGDTLRERKKVVPCKPDMTYGYTEREFMKQQLNNPDSVNRRFSEHTTITSDNRTKQKARKRLLIARIETE